MLDGAARDGIARAQDPILAGQELGHDEQADAAHALGRAGNAREHEVDDVLGEVVLAGRDEDLGAGDSVAAVGLGLGASADEAEVGAAVGLGEVHGAAPVSGQQLGQISRLLGVGAVHVDGVRGARGKARIGAEGEVGGTDHFGEARGDDLRQALAAIVGIGGEAVPAPFGERAVGLLEAGRGGDVTALEMAALHIARLVEGRELLLAQLRCLLEDGLYHIGRGLGETRQVAEALDLQQVVEDEAEVAQGCLIGRHGIRLSCGPRAAPSVAQGLAGLQHVFDTVQGCRHFN